MAEAPHPLPLAAGELPRLRQALLAWYDARRRDLPWRRSGDPYAIWVSEIMLQQTQVATVIPYYERFLARFPTPCALAGASLDEVLALWQGLGYYARARNLHRGAAIVCRDYGGAVPNDPEAFRALPGVGDYIAGAVLSIAFGRRLPAVDGNVVRVLCRLFDEAGDVSRAPLKRQLHAWATELLVPERPGDHNQAMMELGAVVCLPKGPLCSECPLAGWCLARARGTQLERPTPRRRPERPERAQVAGWIWRGEGDAAELLLARRRPHGLLGGLWELPGGPIEVGETPAAALARCLAADLGLAAAGVGPRLLEITHVYTHFSAVVQVYAVDLAGQVGPGGALRAAGAWDEARWVRGADLGAYGLTGITTRALDQLPWPGSGRLL